MTIEPIAYGSSSFHDDSVDDSVDESDFSSQDGALEHQCDPRNLIGFLLEAENVHNSNLIDILGLIKPAKSSPSASSVNLIVRGLFTKNNTILKSLNTCLRDISHDVDERDVFKTFVNDFIIYLENGGLLIFKKFLQLFPLDYDYGTFGKPILHLQNYIDFIQNSSHLLRNPFVIEKLHAFAGHMLEIIAKYNDHFEKTKLNNISFNNIHAFGNSNHHSSISPSSARHNKVSSFFKIEQIVARTKNEDFYLFHDQNRKIELILLDLCQSNTYNALALLSIPHSDSLDEPRSLIYPPFRVNELSISFHANIIILHSLSYSRAIEVTDEIHISGNPNNQAILAEWYNKLSKIFPNSSTPISKEFLIKPEKEFQSSGLGIDTYDYPSSPSAASTPRNNLDKKASFKDLISSPSLSISPLNQLSHRSSHTQSRGHGQRRNSHAHGTNYGPPRLNAGPSSMSTVSSSRKNSGSSIHTVTSSPAGYQQPPLLARKMSSTSLNSIDSNESIKSRYDRSLDIIHKTLSNTSNNHSAIREGTGESMPASADNSAGNQIKLKSLDHSYIKTINSRNVLKVMQEDLALESSRPKSSQAEVEIAAVDNESTNFYSDDDKSDLESAIGDSDDEQSHSKPAVSAKPAKTVVGNFYKIENNNSTLINLSDDYQRKQQNVYSSVPNLSDTKAYDSADKNGIAKKPQASLYQLSNGSAIDIQNFGKNFNPSFSIPDHLSDLTKPGILSTPQLNESSNNSSPSLSVGAQPSSNMATQGRRTRRKSLFSFFKKNSKSNSSNDNLSNIHDNKESEKHNPVPIQLSPPAKVIAQTRKRSSSPLTTQQTLPTQKHRASSSVEPSPHSFASGAPSKDPSVSQEYPLSAANPELATSAANTQSYTQGSSEYSDSPNRSGTKTSTGEEFNRSLSSEESERPLESDEVTSSNSSANSQGSTDIVPPSQPTTTSISSMGPIVSKIIAGATDHGRLSTISEKSDAATPKPVTGSSTLPTPFALPSSTSTYFFKPYKNSQLPSSSPHLKGNASTDQESEGSASSQPRKVEAHEEVLNIPQDLKDVINSDSSIDFYISPSSPRAMKVSKWKQKYGKWEMLTVNENVFLKIVANYELDKSWLLFFKEEYDDYYDEIIDKPILLLNINEHVNISQSSALDLQVTATDSINNRKLLIMVRCANGSLASTISSNLNNILGVMRGPPKSKKLISANGSPVLNESGTISSSLMDQGKPSASSTLTSIPSSENYANDVTIKQKHVIESNSDLIMGKDVSFASLSSEEIINANIINAPDNTKLLLLSQMTIRLQRQLESYASINIPSSWEILSMYSLSLFLINDNFTNKTYYNLVLENESQENDDREIDSFSWLICTDEKVSRIERIGKAGLLIKASESQIFMIECKGKKEFRHLFELL